MRTPRCISVVAPFYREEQGADAFLTALCEHLQKLRSPWEIVCVDDGSPDGTLAVLRQWAKRHENIRVISLSRNFGHQVALLAGLDHVRGDVVVTMDSDLQHPPEYLARMLEAWKNGADIVSMVKDDTTERGFLVAPLARIFYWGFNKITTIPITPHGSDFRMIDRKVLNAVRQFRQSQFFLRGIVSEVGFSNQSITYTVAARAHGSSQFTFRKLLDLALRGFFSYSTLPLKLPLLIGSIGILLAMLEIALGVWKLVAGLPLPGGWLSTYALLTLLIGVVFVFLGIQGFYISKIYEQVQSKPLYCVKEDLNLADLKPAD